MSLIVMLIGVVIVGPLVVGLVALVVVLAKGSKQPSPLPAVATSSAAALQPEERQAILKKLAAGELTKDEAEEQLGRFASPVPETMPAPPPARGAAKGCLIALIVAGLLVPLVLAGLFFLHLFGCRPQNVPFAPPPSLPQAGETVPVQPEGE